MKLFGAFLISFILISCAGLQLEGLSYTLPDGQVASCVPHPDKPDWMQCSYMDGVNEVVIGIEKKRLVRR